MALGCVPGANLDGFWLQKSTKICSWTALGPSFGRLGPSWAVLERSRDVLKRTEKLSSKKWPKRSAKNASLASFAFFWGGEAVGGRARAMAAVFGPDP